MRGNFHGHHFDVTVWRRDDDRDDDCPLVLSMLRPMGQQSLSDVLDNLCRADPGFHPPAIAALAMA